MANNSYGLSDQDTSDLQQIRSLMPANDPRRAKIDTLLGPEKQPTTAQAPTPPVKPATPTAQPGLASRLWGWANTPIFNKDEIQHEIDYSNSGPSLYEAEHESPLRVGLEKAASGFVGNAAQMLTTPLAAGLAATGTLGRVPGAIGAMAKTVGIGAGVGFGVHGAKDIVTHPGAAPNEDQSSHVQRLLGDAAMVAGGAGEVGGEIANIRARAQEAGNPTPPNAQAQVRTAQAVGDPNAPSGRTGTQVYLSPDLAKEVDIWSKSQLPGKRVILRQNKAGQTRIQLAHTADDGGLAYTKPGSKPFYTVEGDQTPNQVPVKLFKDNGVRGTSVPGHFLDAQVGPIPETQAALPAPMPVAAPEMAPQAPATPAPVVPQPEPVAAPPAALSSQSEDNEMANARATLEQAWSGTRNKPLVEPTTNEKVVVPANPATGIKEVKLPVTEGGVKPGELPDTLSKATPRYGYGDKLFQLQFEDPRDLASYTLAQDKPNKAQGLFLDYLRQEFPKATDEQLKARGALVRSQIKALAKSANPEDGPLKIPAVGESPKPGDVVAQKATTPTPAPIETPPTPVEAPRAAIKVAAKVPKLEDDLRPLVGQAVRLSQLRTGEQAFQAIDTAIRSSRGGDGIPDDIAPKIEKLLGEDVGNYLTPEQTAKLENMRGGKLSETPEITYLGKGEAAARLSGPHGEAFEKQLEDAQDHALQRLADPNTPDALKAKLNEVLNSGKPFLMDRTMKYPGPEALPTDHPEAPFTKSKLGNEITPISLQNYSAALGTSPKDLFLRTANTDKYTTPEEHAKLADLENNQETANTSKEAQDVIREFIGNPDELESTGTRVFQPKDTNPEYTQYRRQVYQKVLDRKLGEVLEALQSKTGEWNGERGQALTPLTDQLSKLPPEVRKFLPKDLFAYEGHDAATSTAGTEVAPVQESFTPTRAAKTQSTAVRAGAKTQVEGVKNTKWDAAIVKVDPKNVDHLQTLQKAVAETVKEPLSRQGVYARASQTFHDAVMQKDPFALKQAMDTILRPNEGGYVAVSTSGGGAYTPDQNQALNAAAADAFLTRWEAMSPSELLKKQAGLRSDQVVNRIEQSLPISSDPVVYAKQEADYTDLKNRHDALLQQVGPSTNVFDSLNEWANKFTEQRLDKQVSRSLRGTRARNDAILKQTFDSVDKLMDALPLSEQSRFFDFMSRGSSQVPDLFQTAIDPKFLDDWQKKNGPVPDANDLALRLRTAMDAARDRVATSSGNLKEFLLNYMPGMYDNQAKAQNFADNWSSRRPLAGNSDFLKQKMYEFHLDALKEGLQPVTSNPVRATLMRIEQLNRYSMAHDLKNEYIKQGWAGWYNSDETAPEGWESLNDTVFGEGGIGRYWAPSKVARTFNNFVSTGLGGKWRIPYTNLSLYDGLRSTNNVANQFQLGLSLFHGVETTLNSAFTAYHTGIQQAFRGNLGKGVLNIASAHTLIGPVIQDAWNGAKGLSNWSDPSKEMNYAQLTSDLESANANIRTDPTFKLQQVEKLKQNWEQATDTLQPARTRAAAVAKAGGNLLGSTVEGLAAPLMNFLIPRVKIGAFYRLSQEIHENMVGAPPDAIQGELQKAWDSIDNRFGQVNYDNMFMNKNARDIMALVVRSPGWNIGTFREVGGGLFDAGKSSVDLVRGKGLKVTNRSAYVAAMVMGTMEINALYHYIHTGTAPQGIDYFFPKDGTKSSNGEDNRVYPKDYVYDLINFYHSPLDTTFHKAAPDISTVSDLIRNQDYYHREIRDPGDNPLQQASSTIGYMAHQLVPFSFGNLQESKLRNSTSNWESFSGILPAPRWAGRSTAENLAQTYFQQTNPSGTLDPVALEKKQSFIELRNKLNRGEITDDQVQQAVDKGKIAPQMVRYLYESRIDPPLVNWTKNLRSDDQVWKVWKSATPEEKKILLPTVIEKISKLSTGDQQEEYLKELEDYANQN